MKIFSFVLFCCAPAACAQVDDGTPDIRIETPGEELADPAAEDEGAETPPDSMPDQPGDEIRDQGGPDGFDAPEDPEAGDLHIDDMIADDLAADDSGTDTLCGGDVCPAGQTCCFDIYCANLASSADDCGACGNSCWPNEADLCSSGSCVCSGSSRRCSGLPDDYCCEGAGCVNTNTDQDHCGMCGWWCSGGETCIDGWCEPY